MEVTDLRLEVGDASGVGEARRATGHLARAVGLDDAGAGRMALIVTEAATNMVKHGGGGEFVLRSVCEERVGGIDMLALDRGPGIADLAAALRDGFSSSGTPGTGLGAMFRAASLFDIYSRSGVGTAVFARVWAEAQPATNKKGISFGAVNVPYPGESISGDAWAISNGGNRVMVMVADGLGHGPLANTAASAATATFRAHCSESVVPLLERIHLALRPTRGAAMALAEIDRGRQVLRFAGLGNIAATLFLGGTTRSLVSHHGTAGHDVRRIQEFTYPWAHGAGLVLHSDGLTSRWTLDAYPGLFERHPMLTAALLYRDFRRGRDDATVVVLREAV
jgi:anti-sigma regulatory factor (Ser/Thr protein kinase)